MSLSQPREAALLLSNVSMKGYCCLSCSFNPSKHFDDGWMWGRQSAPNWKSCIITLPFFPSPSVCCSLFQSESHDAVSLFALCLPPSPFPSVSLPPSGRDAPVQGAGLFMSIPTGNPLINVTVCSEIKHLARVLGKGSGRTVNQHILGFSAFFFVVVSCFLIKTGLNRTSASTSAGLHFLVLLLSFFAAFQGESKEESGWRGTVRQLLPTFEQNSLTMPWQLFPPSCIHPGYGFC